MISGSVKYLVGVAFIKLLEMGVAKFELHVYYDLIIGLTLLNGLTLLVRSPMFDWSINWYFVINCSLLEMCIKRWDGLIVSLHQ